MIQDLWTPFVNIILDEPLASIMLFVFILNLFWNNIRG